MEISEQNILGTKPITPLLLGMSFPIMISMLVQALYNVVDSIFVARLSDAALTAVSFAYPVQMLTIAVSVGTSVGVNALLSRRLGEGNRGAAEKVAHNGILLMFVSWAVFAVFGLLGSGLFFSFFTDNPAIAVDGAAYLRTCLVFSLGMFLQICLERLIQVTGRTVFQMLSQLSGAVANIVLDPILIFGLLGAPRMGVLGAAVATVLGQTLGCIVCFVLNLKYNTEVRLHWRSLKFDRPSVRGIYDVGLPSIIMQSIGSVMNFGMNKILITFSETAVSVLGVYFKLQSFVFMPGFGLTNALVPIVGYNYGARNKERIKKSIKVSLVIMTIIMAVGTLIFQVFPGALLSMFGSGGDLARIGEPALRIISLSFLLAGVAIVFSSLFQALGEGLLSLAMSVFRQLVVLLPAAWLLSFTGSLDAVWFSFFIAEATSILLALGFFRHTYKNKIQKLDTLQFN